MRVESLHVYPVKSCAGVSLDEATIGPRGFLFDRNWIVTDEQGSMRTQRDLPIMATVRAALRERSLVLSAPGHSDVCVPIETKCGRKSIVDVWGNDCTGLDEGEEHAAWLTTVLGTPCRLLRFDDSSYRLLDREWIGGAGATAAFADVLPFLVVNTASLAALNEWRAEEGLEPCTIDRFRPNIVLSGLDPWGEDDLPSIQVGEVRIDLTRPCSRCGVPNVDQATGEPEDHGNLQILGKRRRFRNYLGRPGAMFGVQGFCVRGEGRAIKVGDCVKEAARTYEPSPLPRLTR